MDRRTWIVVLAGVPASAACAPSPETAVIVVEATSTDKTYFDFLGRSLPPGVEIRPEPFQFETEAARRYESALQIAQDLVERPEVIAVVGHGDSRTTLALGPVYQAGGVPLVVPTATSSGIPELGPSVFPMVPDDRAQGAFLAEVASVAARARTATVFHLVDEYGIGIRDGVLPALEERGIEVPDVVGYGTGRVGCPADLQPFVDASLLHGRPDVVILGSRSPDGGCLAGLLSDRHPGVKLLAADGVELRPLFYERVGAAATDVRLVRFWANGQSRELDDFVAEWERVTGIPPHSGSPLTVDGIRLLVAAVEEVGPDRRRIADFLRSLGVSRPPFEGLTGPIAFGPDATKPLLLIDVEGRRVSTETW